MTIISIDLFSSRLSKHSLYPFALGTGLNYVCIYQWQGLKRVITVFCLAATLTSEELSPSWRAPCREPAVAVPPAPAPLALSPAPKGAHSPDHKQGPVNGPEFEVKLSLASPWWHSPGKRAWAGNRVTFWLLWLLLLEWPPRCDTEEPLNCSQP